MSKNAAGANRAYSTHRAEWEQSVCPFEIEIEGRSRPRRQWECSTRDRSKYSRFTFLALCLSQSLPPPSPVDTNMHPVAVSTRDRLRSIFAPPFIFLQLIILKGDTDVDDAFKLTLNLTRWNRDIRSDISTWETRRRKKLIELTCSIYF